MNYGVQTGYEMKLNNWGIRDVVGKILVPMISTPGVTPWLQVTPFITLYGKQKVTWVWLIIWAQNGEFCQAGGRKGGQQDWSVCVGGGVVACFEDGGDHKLRNTDSVLELRATPADTKQEHETLVWQLQGTEFYQQSEVNMKRFFPRVSI